MPTIDDEIRSKLEAFADDIGALVRRAALDAVAAALGVGKGAAIVKAASAATPRARAAAPVTSGHRASGRKAGKAAAPKAPSRKAAAARPVGAKRPQAELAKLTEKLGEYIKANPGQRMEAIGKALGKPTRELNLPIKKLLGTKKIRSEGHKRATEYFPA